MPVVEQAAETMKSAIMVVYESSRRAAFDARLGDS
jgi:hypothetical protein